MPKNPFLQPWLDLRTVAFSLEHRLQFDRGHALEKRHSPLISYGVVDHALTFGAVLPHSSAAFVRTVKRVDAFLGEFQDLVRNIHPTNVELQVRPCQTKGADY